LDRRRPGQQRHGRHLPQPLPGLPGLRQDHVPIAVRLPAVELHHLGPELDALRNRRLQPDPRLRVPGVPSAIVPSSRTWSSGSRWWTICASLRIHTVDPWVVLPRRRRGVDAGRPFLRIARWGDLPQLQVAGRRQERPARCPRLLRPGLQLPDGDPRAELDLREAPALRAAHRGVSQEHLLRAHHRGLASAVNNCEYREVNDNSWRSDFYIGYAF